MDDPHRQPRESDRNVVRDRVGTAVATGRISAADGEIRLSNASSAQSMTELDLMTRDLDQLEAALGPAVPVPQALPPRAAVATGSKAGGVLLIAVLGVVVAVVAAAVGLVAFSSSTGGSAEGSAGPPLPDVSVAASPVGQVSPVPEPAVPAYRLGGPGIRSFLAAYRAKFGTSKVVDLTLYDDYVIVQVPVRGRARHAGWIYRDGAFRDFGGVTADFPGSAVIDTRRLDVPALVRNLAKAGRLLEVEEASSRYVTLDYRPQFDDAPNVNIHLSNPYDESGYLATTLDGRVERAYPFGG